MDKAKIWDIGQAFYLKAGSYESMEALTCAVLAGTKLLERQLDDWTTGDIIECGSKIIEDNFLSDLDKKK